MSEQEIFVLAATMFGGLLLWLIGGRLLRAGCVICGFLIGGLIGLIISEAAFQSGEGFYLLVLTLGGAVAGALLAGLLFRFWMALSMAILLGIVLPTLITVIYLGAGPPIHHGVVGPANWEQTARAGMDQLEEQGVVEDSQDMITNFQRGFEQFQAMVDNAKSEVKYNEETGKLNIDSMNHSSEEAQTLNEPTGEDRVHDAAGELVDDIKEHGSHLLGVGGEWIQATIQDFSEWWNQQESWLKTRLFIAGVAGVIIGLALGLLLPYIAAMIQTAIVGSMLILQPVFLFAAYMLPEQQEYLPHTWDQYLLWVAGMSVVGIGVQLFLTRRK